jgi:RimJ/RimL family protein N-acetyltransferase
VNNRRDPIADDGTTAASTSEAGDALHPPIEGPLPNVTTGRLELRRFEHGDAPRLASVFAKQEVWMFPFGRGFTAEETELFVELQVQDWQRDGFGCWVAIERATGTVIGYVGLSVPTFAPQLLPTVEVGWRFDPAVWGQGYATEGAAAALDQAFTTLQLAEVCSLPQVDNPPSMRVAERLGMRRVAELAVAPDSRRPPVTVAHYVITAVEWHNRSQRRR